MKRMFLITYKVGKVILLQKSPNPSWNEFCIAHVCHLLHASHKLEKAPHAIACIIYGVKM